MMYPLPIQTGRQNRDKIVITIYDSVRKDKGSKYAVSGTKVQSKKDIETALEELKAIRKFGKATHNSWGAILSDGGFVKHDDGEAGAGMVILRMLERAELTDHVIIVTRWYGGIKLGGDRFRHIQDCVNHYLEQQHGEI